MSEVLFQYLTDITRMNLQFGDRIDCIMFKPNDNGEIVSVGQDLYKNLLVEAVSRHPIKEIPVGGCLKKLNHLNTVLGVMGDRKIKAGAKIEVEVKKASDQKTDVIGSMTFSTGRTKAQYNTADPFRNKLGNKTNKIKIDDWPVNFEVDSDSVDAFDEAYRIHLSSGTGSKDDLIYLKQDAGEIKLVFGEVEGGKSDPKTETIISHKVTGDRPISLILPAPLLRATMKAMGPDGGIAKLSDKALSIRSESLYALYTITLVGTRES